jgi:hypothetical protein
LVLPSYDIIGNPFLPMMKRIRKRKPMQRPAVLVQWKKDEQAEKKKFDDAVKLVGGSGAAIIRGLIDEWVKIVTERHPPDMQAAALAFQSKEKKAK